MKVVVVPPSASEGLDPGTGIAIKFNDMNREDRDKMHKVLEFVHNTTMFYDNRYFSKLMKS